MKVILTYLLYASLSLTSNLSVANDEPPLWAYPVNPPDYKPAPDDGQLRKVPGSSIQYPLAKLRDRFYAPDWHPQDHPAMPKIVSEGRKPNVYACGFCHRADGPGGPENASIAGLPRDYIVQQLRDFKNGLRTSSVAKRTPVQLKLALAKDITEEEIEEAASYFAALKPRYNVKVIETDSVPKTSTEAWVLRVKSPTEFEPIGQRIIEVPEDFDQFEHRDARARFIAYVPMGSITKGDVLINKGNDKIPACTSCHGSDLKGVGVIPSIVGKSPSYVVRQLYDVKYGTRNGPQTEIMKPIASKLTIENMLAIAASLASRSP